MASKPTGKPNGRPNEYTQELSDKFCELIAQGSSLRSVCAEDGMPAPATIFRWMREQPEFQKQYAHACNERAEAMAEDVIDIADDGTNDWMEKQYGKDSESTWVVNGEALQRSKLRVETRKWLMAKMKPKKYGDRVELDNTGEIIHKYEEMTDEQLEQAIKARQDRIIGTGS